MRNSWPFLLSATLLMFAGCAPSVSTSMGDRWVTGKSASFFSYAALSGDAITLGGKTVKVSQTDITWGDSGSYKLSTAWQFLELDETSNGILVVADGNKLTTIHPL
jgi:hypothetical protein